MAVALPSLQLDVGPYAKREQLADPSFTSLEPVEMPFTTHVTIPMKADSQKTYNG